MLRLGMEEGVPIEHRMVTRSIERAQRQVEAQNFAVRKHLIEYDDVMNKQRTAVYDMRRTILEGKDTREHVLSLTEEIVDWFLDNYCDEKLDTHEWNLDGLRMAVRDTFGLDLRTQELQTLGRDALADEIKKRARERYVRKESEVGRDLMLAYERLMMLQIVDAQWKDHLYAIDHLKEGIGLRGYGQRDPLVEYKKESYAMFQALMDRIDEEVLRWIYLYQPVPASERPRDEEEGPVAVGGGRSRRGAGGTVAPEPRRPESGVRYREPELALAGSRSRPRNLTFNDPSQASSAFARSEPREARGGGDEVQTVRREGKKVGRNDPCPCGSGRKYKKCHGAA
jgi:preprotein translocase subunit SecA